MLKAREILRMKHKLGLSLREIGSSCGCGKSSVAEILKRAKDANITWPIDLSDKQLMTARGMGKNTLFRNIQPVIIMTNKNMCYNFL